jgi:hypothetical protein
MGIQPHYMDAIDHATFKIADQEDEIVFLQKRVAVLEQSLKRLANVVEWIVKRLPGEDIKPISGTMSV